MSTAGTFWFILWRMIVWGLGLALGSGAAYGTIVGLPFFPFGLIFGPLLGAMYGARAGLALGILEGVVLLAVTLLVRWRGTFKDVNRYRRTGRRTLHNSIPATARSSGRVFGNAP